MKILVAGLPEQGAVRRAQAIIRRELAQYAANGSLSVVAHRLHNGDWSLVAFDGEDVRTLPARWSERVQVALRKAGA